MSRFTPNVGPEHEKPPAPILVFDIETVPDLELLFATQDWEAHLPEAELAARARSPESWRDLELYELFAQRSQAKFPATLFHTVICICAVFVHPETYQIIDGFKRCLPPAATLAELRAGERRMLEDFWAFSFKHKEAMTLWYDSRQSDFRMSAYERRRLKPVPVTFCGYNITGFDLPVLEQRSIKHLITVPHPDYAKETGFDSYRSKYAADKIFDLCHFVSNHQANARVGLDALSRSIGLGGKMEGMHGSQVARAFLAEGASQRIEDYCAVDVLVTYGVLLAVQKFRGVLDAALFAESVSEFQKFLLREGKPEAYRELEAGSPSFFRHANAALQSS